jgi:hypothetical protein
MLAVIGENGKTVLLRLEAMLGLVVDHRFGSAYIQGSARPMGTIQNMPETA